MTCYTFLIQKWLFSYIFPTLAKEKRTYYEVSAPTTINQKKLNYEKKTAPSATKIVNVY
jgi:hypothetical protein